LVLRGVGLGSREGLAPSQMTRVSGNVVSSPAAHVFFVILLRDASAERGYEIAFVCPSVCVRYHDHIGWNSSKIIIRSMCMGDLVQREHPQN